MFTGNDANGQLAAVCVPEDKADGATSACKSSRTAASAFQMCVAQAFRPAARADLKVCATSNRKLLYEAYRDVSRPSSSSVIDKNSSLSKPGNSHLFTREICRHCGRRLIELSVLQGVPSRQALERAEKSGLKSEPLKKFVQDYLSGTEKSGKEP